MTNTWLFEVLWEGVQVLRAEGDSFSLQQRSGLPLPWSGDLGAVWPWAESRDRLNMRHVSGGRERARGYGRGIRRPSTAVPRRTAKPADISQVRLPQARHSSGRRTPGGRAEPGQEASLRSEGGDSIQRGPTSWPGSPTGRAGGRNPGM